MDPQCTKITQLYKTYIVQEVHRVKRGKGGKKGSKKNIYRASLRDLRVGLECGKRHNNHPGMAIDELDNVKMVEAPTKAHFLSKPNPFYPSENPTNSERQFIIFGNSWLPPCSLSFRPLIHPTFLPTARHCII